MDALLRSIHDRCSLIRDQLDRQIESHEQRSGSGGSRCDPDGALATQGVQVERAASELAPDHAGRRRPPRPFTFDERARAHVSPLRSPLR